jgi:carbonic anhydrase
MNQLNVLKQNNKTLAARVTAEDPDFLNRLAEKQTPEYLWIGCSDSGCRQMKSPSCSQAICCAN